MKWPWEKKTLPLVLYKRTEKIEWTKADAEAWESVMGSETYRKIEAFMHDRIINSLLTGGDKMFLKGILYCMSALGGFKGQGKQNEKANTKDLSPIQFFDEE